MELLHSVRRSREEHEYPRDSQRVEKTDNRLEMGGAARSGPHEEAARHGEGERKKIDSLSVEKEKGDGRPEGGHLSDRQIGEYNPAADNPDSKIGMDSQKNDGQQQCRQQDRAHRSSLPAMLSKRPNRSFASGTEPTS
jgi:hypothetical protein